MPDLHSLELPDGYREGLPRSWQAWIDQLPEQVNSYLERWELTAVGVLPLSHGYVVPVERADGRACVLKIQPTDVPEVEGAAERELLGLRLAGRVAVEVVEEDARNGVLLLERVLPGNALDEMAERDDDAATEALAMVIRDYGRSLDDPGSMGLRPIEELAEAFERFDRGPHGSVARRKAADAAETRLSAVLGIDELGTALPAIRSARETAERVLGELLADRSEPYLLHGDLHHGNVLVDEHRGLLVIDPWGLYGDRSADVAPALHNPLEFVARTTDIDSLIRRRLAIYAEVLDVDKECLAAWCYAYNVIRALWALEDSGEVSERDSDVRTVAALRHLI
ncbi:MAG: aminoglycoside phosphotransferase family protein [Acidimicrobiales bacterium]